MGKPIADGAKCLPVIGLRQITEFLKSMQFVEHGPIFVRLLQIVEQCGKETVAHRVLQFGEAQYELIPVLNGFVGH